MRCPHCGKEIPDQSHYCLYCMKSLEQPVTVAPAPVSRRPRKLLYLSIGGVLVLAAVLTVYLTMIRPASQSQSPVSETLSSDSAFASDVEESQDGPRDTAIGEYVSTDAGGVIFDSGSVQRLPGADENGFLIEGDVLVQYSGTDQTVEIPEGVREIGERAFMDNRNIQEVILPEGLAAIRTSAFYGCTGLEKILLPSTLAQVDAQAFSKCTSLKEHILSADNPYFVVVDGVLYNSDQTALNSYPAGKEADTFAIPDSVTMLVDWAFEGNSSLESVSMPAGVNYIFCPFGYCPSLREIQVAEENTFFASQDGILFSKDGSTLLCYPPSKEGDTYVIPETVVNMEANAFLGNRYLTSVTVPEGVTTLNTFVFKEVEQLRELYLPSTITLIDSLAIYNTLTLPTIYTPANSVTEDFCRENGIPCEIINS